jgi:predicted nucleotidyltransferase
MEEKFNEEEARKFLLSREEKEKQTKEQERKTLLSKVISVLKQEFKNSSVEVYLVGSILRPFSFSSSSDIDVVLKGYKGDRFDVWTRLEGEFGRRVEIILFETCHFQEFVLKEGSQQLINL